MESTYDFSCKFKMWKLVLSNRYKICFIESDIGDLQRATDVAVGLQLRNSEGCCNGNLFLVTGNGRFLQI